VKRAKRERNVQAAAKIIKNKRNVRGRWHFDSQKRAIWQKWSSRSTRLATPIERARVFYSNTDQMHTDFTGTLTFSLMGVDFDTKAYSCGYVMAIAGTHFKMGIRSRGAPKRPDLER
jgi:hypothetical protein